MYFISYLIVNVARLRPAESDVRGKSSTRSKTTGAVRQVRGDAEVGFRGLGWVPLRGAWDQRALTGHIRTEPIYG